MAVGVGVRDEHPAAELVGGGDAVIPPDHQPARAVAVQIEVTEQGLADHVVVHDVTLTDPSQAFSISRLDSESMTHVPMGIFRAVSRPTYDDQTRAQVESAVELAGGPATDDDLQALLDGKDTWTVEG